jgi:hypothetical protein
MSEIALQGVTKNWGAAHAVKGIDFHVKSGSFVVLLGPSGCGKSTTLRLISGLDTPSSGTIRIGDRDVTHLPPAQRKIAMVFQSYALFPHLNVRENILFGVRVRKEPSRDFESRLKRVADILGLAHLLDRRPSQLSGGQQQRVGHPRDPRSGMRARGIHRKARYVGFSVSRLHAPDANHPHRGFQHRSGGSAACPPAGADRRAQPAPGGHLGIPASGYAASSQRWFV